MSLWENLVIYGRKRSVWSGLLLVFVAALTLEVTSLVQQHFAKKGLEEEAAKRAEARLLATRSQIMDVIDQAETVIKNNIWITEWCLDYPDSLPSVCRRIVSDNRIIVGSTVAMVPGYYPDRPLYSPYQYKDGTQVRLTSLATPEYDYPSKEWFKAPLEKGSGHWSEPYVDTGGGEMMMTTYSVPIQDVSGKNAAVITGDISLEWLTGLIDSVKVYPNAAGIMISHTGRFIVCPNPDLVLRMSLEEAAGQMRDSLDFKKLSHEMLAGRFGKMPLRYKGTKCQVYYAPVDRTGWSICIFVPDSDIYGGVRRIERVVNLLQLVGLIMLIVILLSMVRNQIKFSKLNENKQRIEGELQIARDIQMSMIPKVFPPFPERHDLDMAAAIVPAREVGGDLYDFFIRDNHLFFCIGDVSGKGVPASLVMAVTRSVFRAVSAHETDPSIIVSKMNESLLEMNDSCMFVTLFCGILDLSTGRLGYCNAGHNTPMILTDSIRLLPVEVNMALGIVPGMVFKGQEVYLNHDDALFLYTDGLTEAENSAHEQFGEGRTEQALHGRKSAEEHLENITRKVSEFVAGAPQSDDLTMLFIHYIKDDMNDRIVLKNQILEIDRLSEWMEGISQKAGLDHMVAFNINLALEEAVTNIINYAYPEGTEGDIELSFSLTGRTLYFTLSDGGKPFDPTSVPPADISAQAADRPIGGLGIHLVRKIMDDVNYFRKDGKNILKMTKNI